MTAFRHLPPKERVSERIVPAIGYALLTVATLAFIPWIWAIEEGEDWGDALRPFLPSMVLLTAAAAVATMVAGKKAMHRFFFEIVFVDRRSAWLSLGLWIAIAAISGLSYYFMRGR